MKTAAQILMVAATAGLALLAVSTRKPIEPKKEEPTPVQAEPDAWFV
ncbi:MAG TPA: hypothetical protein VLA33_11985 [Gemmatimonadota bacterium]|nr:hypothetical protein [Gemmatimonadota bacterium]